MKTMFKKRLIWIGAVILALVIVIIAATAALTPQQTNPAFAAAVDFVHAAAAGDESTAFALLDDSMQAYVTAHCPDGQVSACVNSYIPEAWGGFLSVVFRRAAPDGSAWNVDLIATYEKDKGFSGVCIYNRVEQDESGAWRIAGYAGFVACGDPASRNMAASPDAPNRAP